jgi:4-alpha-glucanotransferase
MQKSYILAIIGNDMLLDRSSGILLHITSLPGEHGSGDLGVESRNFADFLERSGQSYWQILPHNPVCGHLGYSPYLSPSTFAGNPNFISLEELRNESWVNPESIPTPSNSSSDFADFKNTETLIDTTLRLLHVQFEKADDETKSDFRLYCSNEKWWLDDYSFFMALSDRFKTMQWTEWPREIALREKKAMSRHHAELENEIGYYSFVQFIFDKQWKKWKEYCNAKNIRIIGDLPIYVGFDSADCWSNPDVFDLDQDTLKPNEVAGVPPDYFSPTGQRWGNPLYKWFGKKNSLHEPTVSWWLKRIRSAFNRTDMVRIDHFRAFENYWAIPVTEKTAEKGEWKQGPSHEFFERMKMELGELPLIAEDLGIITPEVEDLRDDLALPGMKILQFAFDGNPKNSYLPHNIENPNCVMYTGTHDNDTTNGWYYCQDMNDDRKRIIRRYMRCFDDDAFHLKLAAYAFSTVARLVILPMQDILGYGREFRMNVPGTANGNWLWKLRSKSLYHDHADFMKEMTIIYNRLTEPTDL